MSAKLRLTREGGLGLGIELHRGTFSVLVDGKAVGSLQHHETVEVPIDPGHHTLRVRSGRYSSQQRSFDVADGQVVNFRCHGATIWPTYVASIVVPSVGISLRHE